jgi:serine/threonine protein phosphatase 1
MAARVRERRVVALRGNHETAMESFLAGRLPFAAWRQIGGAETLLSYGFSPLDLRRAEGPRREEFAERLPDDHRRFVANLSAFHRVGDYVFVHAGLRPNVAIENQQIDDLTGIRAAFLEYEGDFGFIVVHGHTLVERADFRPTRINLDTGAFITNRLSVLRIDATGAALLAPETQ